MPRFEVVSEYTPSGDQPEAIEALASGLEMGLDEQTLLGVTGSGKTFTMAKIIEKVQRPTLVLAHNKTLAAQLCAEFREFFPHNAVEYFVSYYDYYPVSYTHLRHTGKMTPTQVAYSFRWERPPQRERMGRKTMPPPPPKRPLASPAAPFYPYN